MQPVLGMAVSGGCSNSTGKLYFDLKLTLSRTHWLDDCRCLYRLINGGIDPRKFALNDECASKIRICALVINTWTQDGRSADARKRNPKILDVGVTSLDPSAPTLQATRTSTHFVVKENDMLNKEARKVSTIEISAVQAIQSVHHA